MRVIRACAVPDAGIVDRGVHLRLPVGDLAVLGDVDVAQRPGVLELGAGRFRADRRHADGNRLYFLVRLNLARSWVQRVTVEGSRIDLGLGP